MNPPGPRRRALLHIGTEKTGTTTIQAALAANRPALQARGIAYPRSPGQANHTGLAAYGSSLPRSAPLQAVFRQRWPAADWRAALAASIQEELAGLKPGIHTVVFSGEHCHSHLIQQEDVARLHALLAPHFDEIRVVVYLRRQVDLAASLFTQALRHGATRPNVLPKARADAPYYDYHALLGRWAAVFGENAVTPRLYDRAVLRDGDVLSDLLALLDLTPADLPRRPEDQNRSLDPRGQALLRAFNQHAKARGLPREAHRAVVALLESHFSGPGVRPARAEAEAFQAVFDAGNEAVRARWFPERATLFDPDFSGFPEESGLRPCTREDLIECLMACAMAAAPPRSAA